MLLHRRHRSSLVISSRAARWPHQRRSRASLNALDRRYQATSAVHQAVRACNGMRKRRSKSAADSGGSEVVKTTAGGAG